MTYENHKQKINTNII